MQFSFEELTKQNIRFTAEIPLKDHLSCEILFDKSRTKAWLGQPCLINTVNTLTTPFATKVTHWKNGVTPGTPGVTVWRPKEADLVLDDAMTTACRSDCGLLLCPLKHSQIDLGNPVRELTQVLKSPTLAACKEMSRIIKFVLDATDMGLRLVSILCGGNHEWRLVGHSDSDWSDDCDNGKSVMTFIWVLCGIPILWRPKQASIVTHSSSEAEHIASSELAK